MKILENNKNLSVQDDKINLLCNESVGKKSHDTGSNLLIDVPSGNFSWSPSVPLISDYILRLNLSDNGSVLLNGVYNLVCRLENPINQNNSNVTLNFFNFNGFVQVPTLNNIVIQSSKTVILILEIRCDYDTLSVNVSQSFESNIIN